MTKTGYYYSFTRFLMIVFSLFILNYDSYFQIFTLKTGSRLIPPLRGSKTSVEYRNGTLLDQYKDNR